ncbi:MAG: imidazoleglycerol-phosphate dehydratase HisB [Sporomusaceae bacterium]|jgi:imidazoleglycerol-phosphate dehydratase|nr:imidazoleglycerol-phosphate dehydratase HisB [Sporomusaceae bacterium]
MSRKAEIKRTTSETDIFAALDLDGAGTAKINTGIGFFDHMLTLFAKHGLMDLELNAQGDLEVDFHHTVEDTGIVLGQALKQALADKTGIKRYGSALTPMDECLAQVALDISGRPYLVFAAEFFSPKVGEFDSELTEEFLRAFAIHAGLTLHVRVLAGKNTHHIIEAVFKGLARALREAVSFDERISGVMSTKGKLD